MNFVNKLYESIKMHSDQNAFCIDGEFYTYSDFEKIICKIKSVINSTIKETDNLIGLVTNDDIETYASIIALWLEGKAYVPVNPTTPIDRNLNIFELTKINYVLDSSVNSVYLEHNVIATKECVESTTELNTTTDFNEKELAYILFTSGTTGVPKGVPISFYNINALVEAIELDTEFNLCSSDRCLQMFELTFDFSVVTYLFPLLSGACIYTIPKSAIKYFYIFKLIVEHKLTVLTMVPSIIHYLRPYFNEINATDVRYCSFGGGALHADIAQEWSDCIPNSKIFNYYGPTEYTVYSGYYLYNKKSETKVHNGIISIGTPHYKVSYIIVNEHNEEVPIGATGELCLGGNQLTSGYWNNETLNKTAFFYDNTEDKIRLYKTGDLCYKDSDGNFMFVGRSDFQVKIRGYRVELPEIEYQAKLKSELKVNMIALDIVNDLENTELALVIESEEFDTKIIFEHMKTQLPNYMIPTSVRFIKELPHTINGKIDRKELKKLFN